MFGDSGWFLPAGALCAAVFLPVAAERYYSEAHFFEEVEVEVLFEEEVGQFDFLHFVEQIDFALFAGDVFLVDE